MKRLISFIFLMLIVTFLILMLSPEFGFAKSSKKKWLNNLPGVPPRLYMGNEVYFHTSRAYPGVNTSSPIIKLSTKIDEWVDLAAKSTTVVSGIAGIVITTTTLDGVTYTCPAASFTVIAAPKTLFAVWDSTSEIWSNVTITGRDARGNTISEVVVSTAGTQTETNHAFFVITSVLFGALNTTGEVSALNLIFQLGTGDKMGLMGDVTATSYFYKGYVDGTDETTSFTIDPIYDTWTHSDVPDASDDYKLFYQYDSESNPR